LAGWSWQTATSSAVYRRYSIFNGLGARQGFNKSTGAKQSMRLSREKIVRLSHQITEVLVSSDDVEFVEDRDTIRQQVVQILTAMLRDEEKADAEVRKRITSQKKEILEGSEEWDVLYRKYYADELRRMGIAAAPDDRRQGTASR
jgi:hypothetical protein